MEPIFLPEVESNPHPGPYRDAVETMKAAGAEYPQIWHLFAFRPHATDHLARFTQEIMRGESPLTSGFRELIAAWTSSQNQCPFWLKAHAAVAAELLGNEKLVWSVLRDFESSPLSDKEKALFRFIAKVNHNSNDITAADMEPLHNAGWTGEAIYYAITVCALFNFYNRWVDACGVHAMSDEAHRKGARRSAARGYVRE